MNSKQTHLTVLAISLIEVQYHHNAAFYNIFSAIAFPYGYNCLTACSVILLKQPITVRSISIRTVTICMILALYMNAMDLKGNNKDVL